MALRRLREIVLFVMVTTLLGANVGGARPGARLLVVLLGNLLAVAFASMVNDLEDALDDALTKAKAVRNPISADRLSPRAGYVASFAVAICGLELYTTLGGWPLALGGQCLVLGLLYSWRRVRLKAIPVDDGDGSRIVPGLADRAGVACPAYSVSHEGPCAFSRAGSAVICDRPAGLALSWPDCQLRVTDIKSGDTKCPR